MEWNWSTFVLEIINFLVLVWILKHFFYRPVMDVIQRRRQSIDQAVEEAGKRQSDAEALRQKYEYRLHDWKKEKQKAYQQLQQEIDNERSKRLGELEVELQQKKSQSKIAEQKQLQATLNQLEKTALEQAAAFAGRLLTSVASAELQERLIEMIIEGLQQMPADRIEQLQTGMRADKGEVMVSSAFPVSDAQQQLLQATLGSRLGAEINLRFEQDQALLSGLRISLGSWVLGLNLRDELKGFVELADKSAPG